MRWSVTLFGLLFLIPGAPAFADTQVNACGKYSIWVPDNWKVTINNERLNAESRDGELTLVVSQLEDKAADLLDEDVSNFIDEEIDNTKFTSDRRDKLADFPVRILEGTGTDEGNIIFKALALDPGGNAAVIEMFIYGDPAEMNRPANKDTVNRILRSFKPG